MSTNGHDQSEPLPADTLVTLCEVSGAILGIADFDGRLRWVNPAYCDAFGYSREELLGMPSYLDMIHPDDLDAVIALLASLETESVVPDVEVRVRHQDGSWRVFRSKTAVVDGLVYFSGVDLTDQREHEAGLRRANELLSLFGVGVAHDLQGVFALIEGSAAQLANLVQQSELDTGLIESLSAMLVRSTVRARVFIGALQAVARGDAADRAVVALADIVAEAAADVAAERDASGASITWPEAMPSVHVNAVLVRSVLANQFANTIRYGGEHTTPRIAVAASQKGRVVSLTVTDNGPGLGAAELEAVFPPHVAKASPAGESPDLGVLRRVPSGYGLGLALCRRVIEAHAGRVWAISQPGGSTTLTMELPAAPPAAG